MSNNDKDYPYKAFVVPHTHWDREWYLTFQQFRLKLINTFDNLFAILDKKEDYSDFNFDGQTIVLEDYLEVHPEKEDILKKYISENRIKVGPWYILPDEFLVSGESIVRNLILGHKRAEEFGEVMKIGYLPDPFGHISQMPQILDGFNIDSIIFWRGIEYEKSRGNEFIWQGSDGTELLAAHLPEVGYCNVKNLPENEELAYEKVNKAINNLLERETSKSLLLLNGVDHLEAQPYIPELVDKLNNRFDDIEIKQGNLNDYINYVRKTVDNNNLTKLSGEFRSSKDMMILNAVYSARMYIKQANEECQMLLEDWAEPTSSFAWINGKNYRRNLLWTGWKWLLKNHPHDSICGCSVDQVHKEMMTRFDWSKQISEEIIEENLDYLSSDIKIDFLETGEMALTVFNSLPYKINENVNVSLKFPKNVELNRVKVYTENRQEIPYQLKDYGKDRKMVFSRFDTPQFKEVNYADISFTAKAIPGSGFKTYIIKPIDNRNMPKVYETDIKYGNQYIENEYYKVLANNNGSVDIIDKKNGVTYQECNRFVDGGDAGDEYTYSPPLRDKKIFSELNNISIEDYGPQEVTMKIWGELELPSGITRERKSRKEKIVSCPITTWITLYSNINRIEFKTKFENNVYDHRLRTEFPTAIDTDHCYARGHFDVVKRDIEIPDSEGWVEKAYKTAHNSGFVDVNDGNLGLAVLNRGLPEYEVIPDNNTISLTLLRSVGWLSVDKLEYRTMEAGPCLPTPEAQCQGEHIFSYAVIPHEGNWDEAGIIKRFRQYKTGVRTRQLQNQNGNLPARYTYFTLKNKKLEISTIKKHEEEDKLIMRIFNPTENRETEKLEFSSDINSIYPGNLDESYNKKVRYENGYTINFDPKEIKTLVLEFN